jgi:hypothetical protein
MRGDSTPEPASVYTTQASMAFPGSDFRCWVCFRAPNIAFALIRKLTIALGVAVQLASVKAGDARAIPVAGSQNVYVWQRVWTQRLSESVLKNGGKFDTIDVLAAEVSSEGGRIFTAFARPDWAALKATGRKVGLVVRSVPDPIRDGATKSRAGEALTEVCKMTLSNARRAGVEVTELQLDLDAATSELSAYRLLVRRLRGLIGPVPLVVTVLPDWLRSPDFTNLVSEAGAFVLQVHSLQRPERFGQPFNLCDTASAKRWIAVASSIGVPFRVALPTYGYRVAFGPDDRFIGIQAEGPDRSWPSGSRIVTELADPASMAGFVRWLYAGLPKGCEGVVWFRMPSDGDRLAWRWETLAKVMKGSEPRLHLTLEMPPPGEGPLDITVLNDGEAQELVPGIRLKWDGATLIAADGMPGWQIERNTASGLTFWPNPGDETPLFPGERRQIGWFRLSGLVQVRSVFIR